ncbi:MAG TPA: heme-binding protein [Candidatus Binatia bacterium]|nr:heme-binding protein [Candidatus Binatia bacterium]
MWAAVVDRTGTLCAFETSTTDRNQVWPGSQAIAKAKAFTANAFSNDDLPLSTARLYTFVQPGHSLFGLNDSNTFGASSFTPGIQGGIITFGGGVPLYNADGKIVGGLGVSGDTACTDHEIAKRVRDLAKLNPPGPHGPSPLVDDISYSAADGASVLTHPLCLNTIRNGVPLGNEQPAIGY